MSKAQVIGRRLLIALAAVLLLLMLLVTAMVLVLRSETGTAWVIDQVPGLEVQAGEGSLLGIWQADRLRWQGYGVRLELASPFIDWSPSCLLRKTLCLDSLRAEHIEVAVQAGDETSDESAFSLPTLDLPINVTIGDVRLGEFRFNEDLVWNTLTLAAGGSGTDLNIERLQYTRESVTVSVSGRVDARGDWPLALDVSAILPPPYGDQWQLNLALSGSVNELRVRGQSTGYLDAAIDGQVSPLDAMLPVRLTLKADQFLALDALPHTLTLKNWSLVIDGTLAKGFKTTTTARLPGERGEIDLALAGFVTTEQARDLKLSLSAPYHLAGQRSDLAVAGAVDWSDVLTADADVRLRHFPWYDLIPDMAALPVVLNRLNGQVQYRDGRYQASLDAGIEGPLGGTDVKTEVDGDLSAVTLTNLEVETGAGGLRGEVDLAFAEQIAWDASLELDRLNPGYWVPALEASLSGTLASKGRLDDNGLPIVSANWTLAGTWQSSDTRTSGQLNGAEGRWQVDDFELLVGANEVTGFGRWAEELAATLSLDLPNLSAFMPGLEGALKGKVTAAGQLENPVGNLRLSGSDIRWQDTLVVDTVALKATLTEGLAVQASADVNGIEAAGQTLSELNLGLNGQLNDHVLTVQAANNELATKLRFSGGWQDGWDGVLGAAEIELSEQAQTWVLQAPATLHYRPSGELSLGQHCFEWQASSICADDQLLMPLLALNYRINNFPTSALAEVLPDTVRWDAQINGRVALNMTEAGPDGRIELDASPGTVEVLARESWQSLPYDKLATAVSLKPDQADLSLTLAGPGLGDFALAMTVDPGQESRPVTGRFSLEGLDLSLAGQFVELEDIAGKLNGEGELSGPLLNPEVYGEIALSNGRILDPSLPLPLEDIALSLELAGREARVSGRWRSNDHSEGTLGGRLAWADSPTVDLQIKGRRLPFSYEPYARLELEPDISLSFSEGNLSVSGQVDIPRGEIEVRELPEQAVSVSDDEVILGKEEEQSGLQSMIMDVTVNVGEDRVSFKGFGVTGNLAGSLRVGNNMDTRGALQLNNGHYEAYGQELTLRRARLVFVGPVSEPYLDIEAIRVVGSVTAGLRLSGPVSEPATEVFSEPSMPQSEALAYLILGRPLRNSGEQGQLGQAALSMGLAQTSELTRGLGEGLGIQNLVLEAEGSGDSSSVVASGYLTKDLSLRYGVGVFEPITKVALRYDLGQYFYLEAASGLAASLDLFYTRNF